MATRTLPRRYSAIKAAAEYIGSSEKTIRRLGARGEITLYRHGPRFIRVDLNELDALLEPRRGGGTNVA